MKLVLTSGILATSIATLLACACSAPYEASDDPIDEEAEKEPGEGNDSVADNGNADSDNDNESSLGGQGGQTGGDDAPEEPVCDPEAEDLPDDDFADTNCDGVDGDAANAVFVAPAGDDLAEGSMMAPLATLSAAASLAQSTGRDVYVCNGNYADALTVESAPVRIFGGYDCEDGWSRSAERAVIAPSSGAALSIHQADDVYIEGLIFQAVDAQAQGDSSIAAIIDASKNVRLQRVKLEAGDGGAGQTGAKGTDREGYGRTGADGNPATGTQGCQNCLGTGGESNVTVNCSGSNSVERGGYGGDGADSDNSPTWIKGSATPSRLTLGGQVAGAVGDDGDGGIVGPTGKRSLKKIGQFVGSTYVPPSDGASGGRGMNGRGGGGGAGAPRVYRDVAHYPGGGGGQGGYGGCGGHPGQAGKGGGGSFALLVVDSSVGFAHVEFVTGNGGKGGTGGRGGAGEGGGRGGKGGNSVVKGGDGGNGGDGGQGGSGAAGGGGPTVGVSLVNSALINVTAVEVHLGAPGAGGSPAYPHEATGVTGLTAPAYDLTKQEVVSL